MLGIAIQQQNDSLSAAHKGGRYCVEHLNMTPIARLLKQRSTLCRRALEHTRDVNEAYLLVHHVMVCALSHVCGPESDPGAVLTRALEMRSRRLCGLQAAI